MVETSGSKVSKQLDLIKLKIMYSKRFFEGEKRIMKREPRLPEDLAFSNSI